MLKVISILAFVTQTVLAGLWVALAQAQVEEVERDIKVDHLLG